MGLIISLIIGGIAGLLAGQIRKGHGFGLIGNVVVGLIGGLIGGFLAPLVGITDTNFIGSIIVSTIGAVILLAILSLFNKAA